MAFFGEFQRKFVLGFHPQTNRRGEKFLARDGKKLNAALKLGTEIFEFA